MRLRLPPAHMARCCGALATGEHPQQALTSHRIVELVCQPSEFDGGGGGVWPDCPGRFHDAGVGKHVAYQTVPQRSLLWEARVSAGSVAIKAVERFVRARSCDLAISSFHTVVGFAVGVCPAYRVLGALPHALSICLTCSHAHSTHTYSSPTALAADFRVRPLRSFCLPHVATLLC